MEPQIFRFAEMVLRDRCSTSYDLASLFRGRRSTLDRWSGRAQNALVRGRQLRRIASFLILSTSKIEEVWQNCLVFDFIKFKS